MKPGRKSDQTTCRKHSEVESENTESEIEGGDTDLEKMGRGWNTWETQEPAAKKATQEENRNSYKRRESRWPHKKKTEMKILFWNIRGLGALGRKKQLGELRQTHRVDIVCLQETIKGDFTLGELAGLSEGGSFEWVWTAAQGHSGGTLIGVRTDDIIVVTKDK
jgi:hypothetical protein